jgi:hypothetical protein
MGIPGSNRERLSGAGQLFRTMGRHSFHPVLLQSRPCVPVLDLRPYALLVSDHLPERGGLYRLLGASLLLS